MAELKRDTDHGDNGEDSSIRRLLGDIPAIDLLYYYDLFSVK